jgi:peroxin-1
LTNDPGDDPAFLSGCRVPSLLVQCTPRRDSWVSLPPDLAAQLQATQVRWPVLLELRPAAAGTASSLLYQPLYVAWRGDTCAAGRIALPSCLARSLHLQDGVSVTVKVVEQPASAQSVSVQPSSEDDWEVLELNAGYLEEHLLEQAGQGAGGFRLRN